MVRTRTVASGYALRILQAESDTANGLNTGIAIVNPNSTANAALVRLWDPSTGNQLGSTTVALAANAHVAKLLTELFPTVAGINQIRTQLSIDSCSTSACSAAGSLGFVATALRLNGSLFTTLPVVPSGSTTNLIRLLPHVAFGGDPAGLNFKTALYLTTTVSGGVTGVADIFDDNGNPIAASANGGVPSSHFAFTVLGSRVMKIVLSGDATLRAGWVRLTLPNNASLVVNAVFQTYTGSTLASEASVLESPADTEGLISVNVQAGTNIGVALANPQPTSNTIALTLYNQAGFVAATQFVTLPAFGHLAQYVTTIFPQLASVSSFSGSAFDAKYVGIFCRRAAAEWKQCRRLCGAAGLFQSDVPAVDHEHQDQQHQPHHRPGHIQRRCYGL